MLISILVNSIVKHLLNPMSTETKKLQLKKLFEPGRKGVYNLLVECYWEELNSLTVPMVVDLIVEELEIKRDLIKHVSVYAALNALKKKIYPLKSQTNSFQEKENNNSQKLMENKIALKKDQGEESQKGKKKYGFNNTTYQTNFSKGQFSKNSNQ